MALFLALNFFADSVVAKEEDFSYKTESNPFVYKENFDFPEFEKKVVEKNEDAQIQQEKVSFKKQSDSNYESSLETYNFSKYEGNEVVVYIDKYAQAYGVDENIMREIAYCESGLRSSAVNGPYAGIYQFMSSTWISNRRAMGENPDPTLRYHPEEAAKTAAFKMSRDGFGAWPVCGSKALSKI